MKAASQFLFKTPVKGFEVINREAWNFRIVCNINGNWKIATTATIGDYKNATSPVKSRY